METRDFSAKTVQEAIDQAILFFGVPRDELEIEVISEGRGGVFGIGAEDAKIRVTLPDDEEFEEVTDDEVMNTARQIVEQLLEHMGIEADVDVRPTEEGPSHESSEFTIDVTGADLGILIGRRGETLGSMQFLVNLMLTKQLGTPVRITLDVENYKLRRAQALQALALRMAERAQANQQPITLEAMPPNERRLIHLALRDHPGVMSQSVGEGDKRKVVIHPKR